MVYPSRVVRYLILISTYIILTNATGTVLPPFRQLSNDLQSGKIEIVNTTSIHITNFYYDGGALDAYFWAGKGLPSVNGTLIPDENGSTKPLALYNDKNITINLPNNLTTSDIDYLAVWCVSCARSFGHIFINERYILTKHGTLFLPLKLQPFNSTNVIADAVVLMDEVEIAILNFSYNQTGNHTHFRVGSGEPSLSSKMVTHGSEPDFNLRNYNGENITIYLPENVTLGEIDYLTVWDDDRKTHLDTVYLNRRLSQEQGIDIMGYQLDKLINQTSRLRSGPVLLINQRTLYITNFHHNYNMTEFRVALKNDMPVQIPDETGSYSQLKSYKGESFYLTLPQNISATNVEKFGIWHTEHGFLASITLNSSLIILPYRPHPDVTDDGKRIIRVQKCCPLDSIVTDSGCTKSNDTRVKFDVDMKVHLANNTHLNDDPMTRERIVFAPYINNVDCPKFYLTPEMDNYSLLTTGKLLYISAKEQVPLDKYCMDTIREKGSNEEEYLNTVFICVEGDSGPQTTHIVFAICALLSAISLFLTAGIYFIIRRDDDKRGFSIAGYAGSMGIAFLCLAVTQIAGLESVCKILGSSFHLFIVSSFVWFVVITFEALYHVKYFDQDSVLQEYLKRRRIYIGLSIGIPVLFLAFALVLDLPAGLLNTHLDAVCFFDKQKWMLYTPIIVCIALAITFSACSVYYMRENNNISRHEGYRRDIWDHQRLEVRGKVRFCIFLVALTAVCWLSEIITFSLQFPIFVLDVIHALQGVMVLTTILSTGGIFKKIVRFFKGNDRSLQNGISGHNAVELTRLNSENYK